MHRFLVQCEKFSFRCSMSEGPAITVFYYFSPFSLFFSFSSKTRMIVDSYPQKTIIYSDYPPSLALYNAEITDQCEITGRPLLFVNNKLTRRDMKIKRVRIKKNSFKWYLFWTRASFLQPSCLRINYNSTATVLSSSVATTRGPPNRNRYYIDKQPKRFSDKCKLSFLKISYYTRLERPCRSHTLVHTVNSHEVLLLNPYQLISELLCKYVD